MRAATTPLAPGELTRLLQAWGRGDQKARDRVIPFLYGELRRRAAAHLRRERAGHTLRPTDLVHETYLRLCDQGTEWVNRDQFFGVASHLMRRILVDHARRHGAAKRGRGLKVTLSEGVAAAAPAEPDLLDLDAALDDLAALDQTLARLVELRYFGGLTLEETARAMGISRATAVRDWVTAKSWLFRRLNRRGRNTARP